MNEASVTVPRALIDDPRERLHSMYARSKSVMKMLRRLNPYSRKPADQRRITMLNRILDRDRRDADRLARVHGIEPPSFDLDRPARLRTYALAGLILAALIEFAGLPAVHLGHGRYLTPAGTRYAQHQGTTPVVLMLPLEEHTWTYAGRVLAWAWALTSDQLTTWNQEI